MAIAGNRDSEFPGAYRATPAGISVGTAGWPWRSRRDSNSRPTSHGSTPSPHRLVVAAVVRPVLTGTDPRNALGTALSKARRQRLRGLSGRPFQGAGVPVGHHQRRVPGQPLHHPRVHPGVPTTSPRRAATGAGSAAVPRPPRTPARGRRRAPTATPAAPTRCATPGPLPGPGHGRPRPRHASGWRPAARPPGPYGGRAAPRRPGGTSGTVRERRPFVGCSNHCPPPRRRPVSISAQVVRLICARAAASV